MVPFVGSYRREGFHSPSGPTQFNRQGPDVGTQYRSVVFVHNDQQRRAAEASKESAQNSPKFHGRTIATTIEPAASFWRAEEYHQQYLEKKGLESCHLPPQ